MVGWRGRAICILRHIGRSEFFHQSLLKITQIQGSAPLPPAPCSFHIHVPINSILSNSSLQKHINHNNSNTCNNINTPLHIQENIFIGLL